MGTFATGALAALLLLLLATGALAVIAMRRRPDGGAGGTVLAALVVAAGTAAVATVGAIVSVLATLLAPEVPISVPVEQHWPALPDGVVLEGATAERAAGGFTTAELVLTGLSAGARACLAVAQGLGWLLPAALAALVAVACLHLRSGRAFAPVIARLTAATAVVVLVGGAAAAVLHDVAGSMAAHELLSWTGASMPNGTDPATLQPSPAVRIDLPLWPIGAGLALAALAALLRHGQRIERDVSGLV